MSVSIATMGMFIPQIGSSPTPLVPVGGITGGGCFRKEIKPKIRVKRIKDEKKKKKINTIELKVKGIKTRGKTNGNWYE